MDRALLKKMFDGLVTGKLPLNATEEQIIGFLSPGFTEKLRTKMPSPEATTGDVVVATTTTTSVAVARRRGRPAAIDTEKRKKILLALEAGFTRAICAAEAGVSLRTLKRAIARDAAFREEVERAEAMCEEWPLITIIEAAKKSWHAAAWLLKHKPYAAGRGTEPGKGKRETGGGTRRIPAASNLVSRRRLERRVETSTKLLETSEVSANDDVR